MFIRMGFLASWMPDDSQIIPIVLGIAESMSLSNLSKLQTQYAHLKSRYSKCILACVLSTCKHGHSSKQLGYLRNFVIVCDISKCGESLPSHADFMNMTWSLGAGQSIKFRKSVRNIVNFRIVFQHPIDSKVMVTKNKSKRTQKPVETNLSVGCFKDSVIIPFLLFYFPFLIFLFLFLFFAYQFR